MLYRSSYSVRVILFLALWCALSVARAEAKFQFESVVTLDEMSAFIRKQFPPGTPRSTLRRVFVEEGGATWKVKPNHPAIEKYIYDINLCHYYIWRWNISVDYDRNARLSEAYINGNPVFSTARKERAVEAEGQSPGKKSAIYRMQRPRPEAYKGESSLEFLLLDLDADTQTRHDQRLIGAGPSRADPFNMGQLVTYTDVDPWRSIFDQDAAKHIAPYSGNCKLVDQYMQQKSNAK